MPTIVDYFDGDTLKLAEVATRESKRLTVKDTDGQTRRVALDRVVFEHHGGDLLPLETRLGELTEAVDVPLLWETARDEAEGQEIPVEELAALYFDAQDSVHAAAIFRALWRDRVRFRRRGTVFEARGPDEVTQLQQKLDAEARAAADLDALQTALGGQTPIDDALADRLSRWLSGSQDKLLDRATAEKTDARRQICWRLVDSGHLPKTTDPEILAANLDDVSSQEVIAHAQTIASRPPPESEAQATFAIDDAETQEVDDALSATREGDLIHVDIDIADAASLVTPGDPVDLEARRRATTVYLPTGIYYMLPTSLGCDRGSLQAGQNRGVLRTSLWFDTGGAIVRREFARITARLGRRLDYTRADRLLSTAQENADEPPPSDDDIPEAVVGELRLLDEVARARRRLRAEGGALMLQRPEWKLRVDDEGQVRAETITMDSPSRRLVAEMMIATNEVIAALAVEEGLPIIFRAQARPKDPLPPIDPNDPGALFKLRGLLKPAALSLQPGEHWGLGLPAYTQITSPLRRYGDLVQQRQLSAFIGGKAPPYTARELLEILTTVERTEQEMKRLDAAVTSRWALEHAAQGERQNRGARITAKLKTNYKAQLTDNGAEGLLNSRETFTVGQALRVNIEQVKPRRGALRMIEARVKPEP